jgi:hypothetical protein
MKPPLFLEDGGLAEREGAVSVAGGSDELS